MVPVVHSDKTRWSQLSTHVKNGMLHVPVVHYDKPQWSQLSTHVKNGIVPVVHYDKPYGPSCPLWQN